MCKQNNMKREEKGATNAEKLLAGAILFLGFGFFLVSPKIFVDPFYPGCSSNFFNGRRCTQLPQTDCQPPGTYATPSGPVTHTSCPSDRDLIPGYTWLVKYLAVWALAWALAEFAVIMLVIAGIWFGIAAIIYGLVLAVWYPTLYLANWIIMLASNKTL